MREQQSSNDLLRDTLVGGGAGAAAGALSELFSSDRTWQNAAKRALMGGLGGAALGGGISAMHRIEPEKPQESAPAPVPPSPPKHMGALAALSGLVPGLRAVQGYAAGGTDQALRSGGRSLGQVVDVNALAQAVDVNALAQAVDVNALVHTLNEVTGGEVNPSLVTLLAGIPASVHGAYAAAHNFNERQKSAAAHGILNWNHTNGSDISPPPKPTMKQTSNTLEAGATGHAVNPDAAVKKAGMLQSIASQGQGFLDKGRDLAGDLGNTIGDYASKAKGGVDNLVGKLGVEPSSALGGAISGAGMGALGGAGAGLIRSLIGGDGNTLSNVLHDALVGGGLGLATGGGLNLYHQFQDPASGPSRALEIFKHRNDPHVGPGLRPPRHPHTQQDM